jgi:hypothetical protein
VQFVLIFAVLLALVWFVTAPLRNERPAVVSGPDLGDLQAARDAKYREIRDAELDHSTGKLSDADFEALDRSLRAEAIEILHRIDTVS